MAKVTLNHVYKVYEGGVRAVNDFDLDIKDKEFIVFVGPSGCGKSTTLRMIAGLESITAGQLYIDDMYVNETDSKDRDIAMVFQSYALYPHMTVFQNMAFGLKLRKFDSKEIERRVKEAAEILEITDLLTRKPKALSGGQRQRVALGRAIVREPKVFLLDEPLSNLDAKLRVQMRTEITKLHKKLATTFIYVTHDQTEAMTMGDRIVVMKLGRIQQVDTPINLYENPSNLFVATFLGSPQMNILPATLSGTVSKMDALLFHKDECKVSFPEYTSKQLIDKTYLGKDVLLGIRPEHISVADTGLAGYIDVTEQLGDQTILYVKVEGVDAPIIVKGNVARQYEQNEPVFLKFDMKNAHLFDPKTEESVLGVPIENRFPCTLKEGVVRFGSKEIVLSQGYKEHLLEQAYSDGPLYLTFSPKSVYLNEAKEEEPIKPLVNIDVTVDFVERKTDSVNVFANVKGCEQYLAFALPLKNPVKAGDKLIVTIDEDKLILKDDYGTRLTSHEVIVPNVYEASIETKDGHSAVSFGGNKVVVDDLGVADGKHEIKILEDHVQVLFDKKTAKDLKISNPEYDKNKTIEVSAYDEDLLGPKNAVFVQVKGFPGYSTFVVDDNFSVYRMPKFSLLLLDGAIIVTK